MLFEGVSSELTSFQPLVRVLIEGRSGDDTISLDFADSADEFQTPSSAADIYKSSRLGPSIDDVLANIALVLQKRLSESKTNPGIYYVLKIKQQRQTTQEERHWGIGQGLRCRAGHGGTYWVIGGGAKHIVFKHYRPTTQRPLSYHK